MLQIMEVLESFLKKRAPVSSIWIFLNPNVGTGTFVMTTIIWILFKFVNYQEFVVNQNSILVLVSNILHAN